MEREYYLSNGNDPGAEPIAHRRMTPSEKANANANLRLTGAGVVQWFRLYEPEPTDQD